MAKKNLWLGMLAIALIFGMIGCGPVEEDDSSGESSGPDYEDEATFFGTYTAAVKVTGSEVETIVLGEKQFKISDETEDYLDFTITKWENVTTPADYADDYPYAFKFTGRIKAQQGYVPSGKTAPDFDKDADVKADLTGTECWMFIYFNGEGNDFTFVRTAFSKAGKEAGTAPITDTNSAMRIYKKK